MGTKMCRISARTTLVFTPKVDILDFWVLFLKKQIPIIGKLATLGPMGPHGGPWGPLGPPGAPQDPPGGPGGAWAPWAPGPVAPCGVARERYLHLLANGLGYWY